MRVGYVGGRNGKNEYTGRIYRYAEIWYDEEDRTERQAIEYIYKALEIRGWKPEITVAGWMTVSVFDRGEYEEFLRDYKEIKRSAALNAKFFPHPT